MRINRHMDPPPQYGYSGISCKTVRVWIEEPESMNGDDERLYSAHLETCPSCRQVEELERLVKQVAVPNQPPQISADFELKLMMELGITPFEARAPEVKPTFVRPLPVVVRKKRFWSGARIAWAAGVAAATTGLSVAFAPYIVWAFRSAEVLVKGAVAFGKNFSDAVMPVLSRVSWMEQLVPVDQILLLHALILLVPISIGAAAVGWAFKK